MVGTSYDVFADGVYYDTISNKAAALNTAAALAKNYKSVIVINTITDCVEFVHGPVVVNE